MTRLVCSTHRVILRIRPIRLGPPGTASLAAWGLAGDVTCTRDGAIAIDQTACNKTLRIEPQPPDTMFRWMVTVDGRKRPAISLPAALRQVRAALDPDFAAARVRVSLAPFLVP